MNTGSTDAELEQILDGIGPRLRRLRRERGLTLEALAATTGISVSTLSRVESGRRRPTLDLLIPWHGRTTSHSTSWRRARPAVTLGCTSGPCTRSAGASSCP